MAERAQPLNPAVAAGAIAALTVAAIIGATIAAIAARAEGPASLGPADWAAVRFTVGQAVVSAVLSVALAVPVARALARRRFKGRRLLIALFGAPFILPVIVAILGLIAVFGQEGLLGRLFTSWGHQPPSIYGLQGVVLAHVFFNLPLAIRLILQGWQAIPAERFRLAASLGLSGRDVFRTIEMPMLRANVPGALLVVFLICLTSFAVALTLGGGPRATTIELAIYQAFRFDFDLAKAALLGLLQLVITLAAATLAWRIAVPAAFGAGLDRPIRRWDADLHLLRLADAAWIGAAAVFLLLPIGAVVLRGAEGLLTLPHPVWLAVLRSFAVALTSAALTLVVAGAIAGGAAVLQARRRHAAQAMETAGYLTIAASPLVIGTGLFILLFPLADPVALALPVTALVNALMSLPFALRVLAPAVSDVLRAHGPLTESLGMPVTARLRWIYLPRLRGPICFCLGLSAALSMGDLGVIALFADPETATLPLQIYRLMAAYRMDEAASAASLLVIASFTLFWLFDRGGRAHA